MYWQRAVNFPLVDRDHLVQELSSRLLSQENRFLEQYLVPAKLNAFNSGVQDKLYETCNPSFKEERLWQWNFKGGKQSGLIQLIKNTWIFRIFQEIMSPDPLSMSRLELWALTRPYCISPQYAPPRLTNKKCVARNSKTFCKMFR